MYVCVCVTLYPSIAENDSDYRFIPMEITFTNVSMEDMCVDVPIIDDSTLENVESFTLSLSSSQVGVVTLDPNSSTVTIMDDDSELVWSGLTTPLTSLLPLPPPSLRCNSLLLCLPFPCDGGRDSPGVLIH